MQVSGAVLFEQVGHVGCVTLNRPAVGNTIDMGLALELERTVDLVVSDERIRCVMLTGAGRLFCAGGDVAAMAAAGVDAPRFLLDLATTLHRSVAKLAKMPKPLVVLVNGPAAGAGLSLAIAGDLVLAASSAHFTAAYGGVGLTPDGGMSWLLPKLVGLRRAQEIILTNRRIGAEEAASIGLVTRAVDDGALVEEGMALAKSLASGPVHAFAGARALLADGYDSDLAAHLQAEAGRIAQAGAGDEAAEGVGAFLARRPPNFIEGRSND